MGEPPAPRNGFTEKVLSALAPVAFSLSVVGLVGGLNWGNQLEAATARTALRFENFIERDRDRDMRIAKLETKVEAMARQVLLLSERQQRLLDLLRQQGYRTPNQIPDQPPL